MITSSPLLLVALLAHAGPRSYDGALAVPGAPARDDRASWSAIDHRASVLAVDDDVPAVDGRASAPSVSPAATPAAARVVIAGARPRSWTIGGFVDTAYAFNSNAPDNHISRGAVLAPRTGEFTLQTVALYVRHPPRDGAPLSFELALQAGAAVDALYAAEPVPGGDAGRLAGAEVWKHIGRANVGARARSGTAISAGLFASPLGIGGFWSKDNWNYSASWESRAAAFYFAGVRLSQELPAGLHAEAWLVNGFQTLADVNRVPSYLAGLSWSDARWNVAHYVYFGPDAADTSPRAWRTLVSSQFTYTRGRLAIAAVWDVGRERRTELPDEPIALWTGGAAFVRARVLTRRRATLDLAARPGAFLDRDARMFGARGWLLSGTATATLRLFEYLMPRLEYRYDHALGPDGFFYRGAADSDEASGLARRQHTVFFSVVGMFEHAFAAPRQSRHAATKTPATWRSRV